MRHADMFAFRPGFDPNRDLLGGGGFALGFSLSGHERNHLFANRGGEEFADVSGVSGIDHPADGRAVGWLDYDRDGWLDLAVVNANSPLFQLFRNQLGDESANDPPGPGAGSIFLRFRGGNRTPAPSDTWSARDGFGARVELRIGARTLLREHRAGEGFAAQNSAVLPVGVGAATQVDGIRVRWPSGRVQEVGPVAAGSLVTLFEDASEGAGGSEVVAYGPAASIPTEAAAQERFAAANPGAAAPVQLYTTMATWCETCRGELPHIARLRARFGSELAIFGLPTDEGDSAQKLGRYVEKYAPAYEMLAELPWEQRAAAKAQIEAVLRRDALPASVLTDSEGRILEVLWGVPTVSKVRQWLAARS